MQRALHYKKGKLGQYVSSANLILHECHSQIPKQKADIELFLCIRSCCVQDNLNHAKDLGKKKGGGGVRAFQRLTISQQF